MNEARSDSPAGVATPPRGERWPLRRWLKFIVFVFAAQILLLFVLGERHFQPVRAVENVPHLALTDKASEWIALNDPTLFALPHANDFAAAVWLKAPVVPPPSFRWTESPRWLGLNVENLGMVFSQFMQTNPATAFELNFKPKPEFAAPAAQLEPAFAEKSTVRLEGNLARRSLLAPMDLPSWSYGDVIAPSRVRVLVTPDGGVLSPVLLPASDVEEAASHYDPADQRALQLARSARFTPAAQPTAGLMIFNWRTVAPAATASPQ